MTVNEIAHAKAEQAINVIKKRYPLIAVIDPEAVGFAHGVVEEAIRQAIEQWHAIGTKPKPSRKKTRG